MIIYLLAGVIGNGGRHGSPAQLPVSRASRYGRSSRRASERLCTSSGPSANRRVRALAHRYASGKSWLTPAAPCAVIALSITHSAMAGVMILMAWISVCAPLLPTVSISQAVFSTSSRACSIRTRASAIHPGLPPGRFPPPPPGPPRSGPVPGRSPLDHPLVGQRLPERDPVGDPAAEQFQGPLGGADQPHAVVDPARAQPGLPDPEA